MRFLHVTVMRIRFLYVTVGYRDLLNMPNCHENAKKKKSLCINIIGLKIGLIFFIKYNISYLFLFILRKDLSWIFLGSFHEIQLIS